jgi:hypothetical protein
MRARMHPEVDILLFKGVSMRKGTILKVINAVLGVLIVTQASSGLLADEIGETAFDAIHIGGGILLVACAVGHVGLNWGWVKANYFKR